MTDIEKVHKLASILDSKKGRNIIALDLRGATIIADYFVICSAGSTTLVKALADYVEDEFAKEGLHAKTREGRGGTDWLLLDYGDVIIHIFYKEMREFYGLDKLWNDAQSVDIKTLID